MAQQVNSASSAYASNADAIIRANQVVLADLCMVSDTPIDPNSLLTDPTLSAALLDASGIIETAATVGGRYDPSDITSLSNTVCAGQGVLKRLCVWVAVGLLWFSRPDREGDPPKSVEWASEMLEKLENGIAIFPFAPTQQAGNTGIVVEQPSDVVNRNGVVFQASRFFGVRSNMRPAPPF